MSCLNAARNHVLCRGYEELQVEVARLREALKLIADGTTDSEPPFRVAPENELRRLARAALNSGTVP